MSARNRVALYAAVRAMALATLVSACGSGGPMALPSTAGAASSASTSVEAPATGFPSTSPSAVTPSLGLSPSPVSGLPDFHHVYVIIMENKPYRSIVGSAAAPYINALIAKYGSATQLYAETHPSQPNYIALTSGGLQGAPGDRAFNTSAPNLFDQIEASGRTWHVYAQDYPGGCYKSDLVGGVDGPGAAGEYVRKHNPTISYTSITGNPARCANITKLAGFNPAAADFEMIVPNLINDMHSSSTRAGDDFLRAFVPKITGNPAFAGSVLFITWDESFGSDLAGGGGHIATVIASPGMAPGTRFTATTSHYSILRTIELAWGMPLLGAAATAATITLDY